MKLTLALLLAIPAASAAFSIAPSAAFARRSTSSSSSTLLMASKNAKKIASRTEWAASRGITSGDATPAMATGLMQNESGLEFVKLVHPITGATSEVYLYGGVVTSFKDGDGTEFIAVRPDAKTDGSKPISGGLSHCWPQVGGMCLDFLSFLFVCFVSIVVYVFQILVVNYIHSVIFFPFSYQLTKHSRFVYVLVWTWCHSTTWICS